MEEANALELKQSEARLSSTSKTDIRSKSFLRAFEELILKFPPRDFRYDSSYRKDHYCSFTDSAYMKDVFKGMDVKVVERLPQENRVKIGVFFQTNVRSYDSYNINIAEHNKAWAEAGKPFDVIDPVTGDIHILEDTFVPEAKVSSKFIPEPKLPSVRKGKLAKSAPTVERTLYLICDYKIDVEGPNFVLGFACYTTVDKLLYYNEIESNDLSYLAKRSTQELFGHPFIQGNKGSFLDGISFLIQGRKLEICKERSNKRPSWVKKEKKKDKDYDFVGVRWHATVLHFFSVIFGYILPLSLSFYCFIMNGYEWLVKTNNSNPETSAYYKPGYELYQSAKFAREMLICVLLIYLALQIGIKLRDMAEQLKLKSKFI